MNTKFTTQTRPADLLLPCLRKAKQTGTGRWIACCPGHDDRTPSLAIRELDDGRVLLHCFGGCTAAEIVSAVGLSLANLFPPQPHSKDRYSRSPVKPAFFPGDVLRLIHSEVIIVLVAAYAAMQGKLCDDDVTRLELAVDRLRDAFKLAGVRP